MAEHGEDLLELSLDTFLTVTREDQFPLELATHLSLEQCQQLIPQVCHEKQSHHLKRFFYNHSNDIGLSNVCFA